MARQPTNNLGPMVRWCAACAMCSCAPAATKAIRSKRLIVFFAVHGEVTEETAQGFIALVSAWAAHAQTRDVDLAALRSATSDGWHRGELDADEPPHVRPVQAGRRSAQDGQT